MGGDQRDDDRRHDPERRFQAIYEAHYRAVVAYARRRSVDVADVQDAVSETFTIAWRRLSEVPDAEAALPWLYGVARRVMANQRRGNRRRVDLSLRLRSQERGTLEIESEVIALESNRAVLAALARLRDADQEILRLAVWEELPHRDIAEIVDCSESSVAVRLHRARQRLGREIEKERRRIGQVDRRGRDDRAEGQIP